MFVPTSRAQSRRRAAPAARESLVGAAGTRFVTARTLGSAPTLAASTSASAAPGQSYVELVEKSFEGPMLRYSNRLFLLGEADRRGIAPTEARRIIAAVQRRAESDHQEPRPNLALHCAMKYGKLAIAFAVFASAWCWVLH